MVHTQCQCDRPGQRPEWMAGDQGLHETKKGLTQDCRTCQASFVPARRMTKIIDLSGHVFGYQKLSA